VGAAVFVPTQRIFGRDEDLRQVLRPLGTAPALVTVTGRGGVGKTRLAVEAVRSLVELIRPEGAASGTSDEMTWVRLAGVTSPDLVVTEIATALGIPVRPGAEALDMVAALAGHGSRLLVLDSAEHVLESASVVGELLDRCPNLRILVTSQAPLDLQSEQVVSLAPLPVPDESAAAGRRVDLEALAQQPSVATYCQRASAVDRTFALTDDNVAAVVALCRRLEGLPLALELAGARAATLSAAEIVSRLDGTGLDLLRRGRAGVPDRHQDLRAAIGWSYRLLDRQAQRALRNLSVLSGSFDLDMAAEMIAAGSSADASDGSPFDLLSSLVDLHLVDPVPGSRPTRFVLAGSIRTFAREELVRLDELDEVERVRVRARAQQAHAIAAEVESFRAEGRVAEVEVDRDDVHAALEAALRFGLADEALDLVRGLGPYWDVRGFGSYPQELVERSLALAELATADVPRVAGALLWSAFLGLRHRSAVPTEALVDRIRRADDLAAVAGDDALRFYAQCVWILVAPFTGDLDRARIAADVGFTLAERNGNDGWRSAMQVWVGMLANLEGDEARAIELGTAALDTARRAGDLETVVRAVMLLGPMADRYPDQTRDLPTTEAAIAMARQLGLPFYEALLLVRAVGESTRRGDLDGALRWAIEALAMARTMPESPLVGFCLMAVSNLAQARGDPEPAALLHGSVRASLPMLEHFLTGPQLAGYWSAVDGTRAALGDRFDPEVVRGADLHWGQAVEAAIAYLERVRDVDVPRPDRPRILSITDGPEQLTGRQEEVLRLLAVGLTNKEIAAALGIRTKTVMHHTTAVYRILGVRGRSEAAAFAFRAGLVD
jgi:predicted ATPase/DNA-binding CsgD family transcriptional regulator